MGRLAPGLLIAIASAGFALSAGIADMPWDQSNTRTPRVSIAAIAGGSANAAIVLTTARALRWISACNSRLQWSKLAGATTSLEITPALYMSAIPKTQTLQGSETSCGSGAKLGGGL